jgi:hypothetical protein
MSAISGSSFTPQRRAKYLLKSDKPNHIKVTKKKPSGFAGRIIFKDGANPEGSSYLGTGEHPSRTGYSPQVIDNGGSSLIS